MWLVCVNYMSCGQLSVLPLIPGWGRWKSSITCPLWNLTGNQHFYKSFWLRSVWEKSGERADGQISCRNAQKGLTWGPETQTEEMHRNNRTAHVWHGEKRMSKERKPTETCGSPSESLTAAHTVILRGRWHREVVQVEQRGCWLYGAETASGEDREKTERGRQIRKQT